MKAIQKKLKLPYQNFEQTFLTLLKKAKRGPISVHTFLTTLSGKGRLLLLIFLSLGFTQFPGISMFFGLFISYLGLRIAAKKSFIWMPKFLRYKKISSYFLIKVIQKVLNLLKFMKRWSKPRYVWATQKIETRVINGLMVTLVGICLAISPPVPLTGLLACAAICLIAIGLLNDDGIYIILGYVFALLYLVMVLFLLNYCSFSQMCGWAKDMVCFLIKAPSAV